MGFELDGPNGRLIGKWFVRAFFFWAFSFFVSFFLDFFNGGVGGK